MKVLFKDKCLYEERYLKYTTEISGNREYIVPDKSSGKVSFCPFDVAIDMVLDYLSIGFTAQSSLPTADLVLDFVCKYGFPHKNDKRLDAAEFAEDARMLYLHFAEAESTPYPDEPDFVLETDPVSAIIKVEGNQKFIEWQTDSLSNAIELAYTLLLCGNARAIGVCKHCGAPFYTKNPKSEFCSPPCRNRYNVYKSRAKNQ